MVGKRAVMAQFKEFSWICLKRLKKPPKTSVSIVGVKAKI
jgi:hypothetical protein